MKCEHCGKNEVSFVYQSSVNGKVTQAHLCSECAQKLGLTQKIAARQERMMRGFFDNSFFGGGLLEEFFSPEPRMLGGMDRFFGEDLFDDFFSDMPALTSAPEAAQKEQQPEQKEQSEQKDDLVGKEEQSRFARLRRMNALRMELRHAVHEQNFERAAQLRDQIRALEQAHETPKEGN